MLSETKKAFEINFLKICENPRLTPSLNDLEKIEGTNITFICFSTTVFDMLRENFGTHLSLTELQQSLDCEYNIAEKLFNAMNVKSKNISCNEFQDFLSKGDIAILKNLLELQEVCENLGIIFDEKDNLIIEDEIVDEEIEEDFSCLQVLIDACRRRLTYR